MKAMERKAKKRMIMSNKEIDKLINKISLKQNNNMDVSNEAKELASSLAEKALTSKRLSALLSYETDGAGELEEYIRDAKRFPLYDLEQTIYLGLVKAQKLKEVLSVPSPNKNKIIDLISAISAVQWHFNEVSKPLTSEYITSDRSVTSYSLISPYMDIDTDMVIKELTDYEAIVKETLKALADKDMKALYKCNADIMTVSGNIGQYIFVINK